MDKNRIKRILVMLLAIAAIAGSLGMSAWTLRRFHADRGQRGQAVHGTCIISEDVI